jgi:RND family efflux transporter MFP subunit
MNLMIRLSCLALPLCLIACGKPEAETEIAGTALVQVEAAQSGPMTDAVIAYGSVEAGADQACAVSAAAESQVQQVLVQVGEPVRRGQAVLRVLPSPATTLDLGNAQREARSTQVELQRVAGLREQQLATESELQAARSAAESAAALRDSLQSRAAPGAGVVLTAPCDAVVDELAFKVGEWLPAGGVALRLTPAQGQSVRLGVEPDAMHGLKNGARVQLADLEGHDVAEGRIAALDRRIDKQSGLAAVLVQADAGTALTVGQRLRAALVRGVRQNALSVPSSAITFADDQPQLYVVVGGKAQRREPRLGLRDEGRIEILEGLKAGETVVVLGNDALSDGAAVRLGDAPAEDKEP